LLVTFVAFAKYWLDWSVIQDISSFFFCIYYFFNYVLFRKPSSTANCPHAHDGPASIPVVVIERKPTTKEDKKQQEKQKTSKNVNLDSSPNAHAGPASSGKDAEKGDQNKEEPALRSAVANPTVQDDTDRNNENTDLPSAYDGPASSEVSVSSGDK